MTRGRFTQEIEGYPVYDPFEEKECREDMKRLMEKVRERRVTFEWGSDYGLRNYQPPENLGRRKGKVTCVAIEEIPGDDNSGLSERRLVGFKVWLPDEKKTVIVPGGDITYESGNLVFNGDGEFVRRKSQGWP